MLDGLRSFFSSPYLLPVTEPFKNVVRITAIPLRGFFTAIADSWEGEYTGWPKRFLDEVCRDENGPAGLIAVGGGMVGGVLGFMALGAVGPAGIGGIAGTLLLASAGAGIGVVTGPFVMAAAVGAVALTVGCALGVVPGVIMGTAKMLKHVFSKKAGAHEPAAPANDDSDLADVLPARIILRNPKTAAEMMQSFSTLQGEERKAFEAIMMDHLRPAFEAAAAVALPKDDNPAFANKGAAFGKIGKLVV
jgi:hypothetical protein